MTPHVPTSRRLRGLYMSTMLRVKSSAFAPSLTRIASGFACTMSRTTLSALWKFIGVGFLASVSAILATFAFFLSPIALSQSAGGICQRIRGAFAEDDQSFLGRAKQIERALHRLGRGNLLGRRVHDLDERLSS